MNESAAAGVDHRPQPSQLSVLLEMSSLAAQDDLPTAAFLQQVPPLLIRLLHRTQSSGALVCWRGAQYAAGRPVPNTRQVRALLDPEQPEDNFIAVTSPFGSSQAHVTPQEALDQRALDHAATVLSLVLEHRELESERDALRNRKALLERIISHSPVIAFIWDPAPGWPVKFVSDNIMTLGYSVAEFESGLAAYEDIIHPDDRERVIAEVKANLKRGLKCYEQRYRLLTKSGDVRLVRDWTLVSRDSAKSVLSIEGIIEDITDLAEADERARRHLEITNNIYLVIDSHGVILDVNEKTCALVKVARNELLGMNWLQQFIPDEKRAEVLDYFRQILDGSATGVQEYENDVVSASGARHRVHWYLAHEHDEEGNPGTVLAFGADVTVLRKSEALNKKHAQILMQNPNPVLRLSHDGDVVVANAAAQQLLSDLAEHGEASVSSWQKLVAGATSKHPGANQELMVGDRTYLFMISTASGHGYVNLYGLDVSEAKELGDTLKSVGDNIPGAVFEYTRSPDGIDSIDYINAGCEQIWEISALELRQDPTQLWAMIDPQDLPGVHRSILDSAENLSHWAHEWRIITRSGKVKWLRSSGSPEKLADGSVCWTAVVVDITETRNVQEAVSAALRKTIYVLSAALEARDPYTAGHEQRVTKIAVQIGRELNLDLHRLTGLELAAMVHDVGKIRVPAEILSKPGRLTKEEFDLIKTHPAVGADLLQDIDFEWAISAMVRQHHERIDGSGYPDGLKGEDILLEARIIAVADTLEAMASHRPYRPGLGIETAAAEIRDGSGIRYDPQVAEACLRLVANGTLDLDVAASLS